MAHSCGYLLSVNLCCCYFIFNASSKLKQCAYKVWHGYCYNTVGYNFSRVLIMNANLSALLKAAVFLFVGYWAFVYLAILPELVYMLSIKLGVA